MEQIIRGKLSSVAAIDRAIGDDGKSIHEFKDKGVNKLHVQTWMLPLLPVIRTELLFATILTVLMMINVQS